jgi:putative DNA primase/helicase
VVLIPFEAVIPDEEKDLALTEKLMAEVDGIFTWMVQGCFEWQKSGLCQPEEISAAIKEYRSEMDSISNFIDERFHVAEYAQVWASEIYKNYKQWCIENGEPLKSQKKLGDSLKAKGFTNQNSTGNRVLWKGLGLVDIPRAGSRSDKDCYTA